MNIHPTAIIDKEAEIDESVIIGAYSIIEKGVSIGENTVIGPYVHIAGNTTIGKGNKIYTGAVIGQGPQDISFDKRKKTGIIIGDNNTIREQMTIHLSTSEEEFTKIGNNCYLMVGCHIAHDNVIEDNVIIANSTMLGGFVWIEKNAFLSGNVGVHQHCRIGSYTMIGSNEKVSQDIVPFTLVNDFPPRTTGINLVGLKRAGFSAEERNLINRAYKIIFRENLSITSIIERLENEFDDANVRIMTNFIKNSAKNGRGILK